MSAIPLALRDVSVVHHAAHGDVTGLQCASIDFPRGSTTAIVGRSGSGKSSLVAVAGLMRAPSSGVVLVDGTIAPAQAGARASVRARTIGMVFQSFHLDARLSAQENCAVPWMVGTAPMGRRAAYKRAEDLLDQVGIGHLASRRVVAMSGGERQRVAIARSLFAEPRVLIADEPTGNLDEETAAIIAEVLYSLARESGTTVIVVTHDHEIARGASQILTLERGTLVGSQAAGE